MANGLLLSGKVTVGWQKKKGCCFGDKKDVALETKRMLLSATTALGEVDLLRNSWQKWPVFCQTKSDPSVERQKHDPYFVGQPLYQKPTFFFDLTRPFFPSWRNCQFFCQTNVLGELDKSFIRTQSKIWPVPSPSTALSEADLFFRPHKTLFLRNKGSWQKWPVGWRTKAGRFFLRQPLDQKPTFFFDLTRPFFSHLKKVDKSDLYSARQKLDVALSLTALGEPPSFFRPPPSLFSKYAETWWKWK